MMKDRYKMDVKECVGGDGMDYVVTQLNSVLTIHRGCLWFNISRSVNGEVGGEVAWETLDSSYHSAAPSIQRW
jgi:hypothetical protein